MAPSQELSQKELREQCKKRAISAGGTKADLAARIAEYDSQNKSKDSKKAPTNAAATKKAPAAKKTTTKATPTRTTRSSSKKSAAASSSSPTQMIIMFLVIAYIVASLGLIPGVKLPCWACSPVKKCAGLLSSVTSQIPSSLSPISWFS